jgi:hypothetical protein
MRKGRRTEGLQSAVRYYNILTSYPERMGIAKCQAGRLFGIGSNRELRNMNQESKYIASTFGIYCARLAACEGVIPTSPIKLSRSAQSVALLTWPITPSKPAQPVALLNLPIKPSKPVQPVALLTWPIKPSKPAQPVALQFGPLNRASRSNLWNF